MWMQRGRLPGRQRGSIILPAVAALIVCLILLGSANLGYLFYVKRELQNAADLAALSGAQYIEANGVCGSAPEQAYQAIDDFFANKKIIKLDRGDVSPECGVWDPDSVVNEKDHFLARSSEVNAIRVVIDRKDIVSFFPFFGSSEISVAAVATASVRPVAAFSVGPQLLRLDDGLLTALLSTVGLDLRGVSLADYRGLANIKITPAGLLGALGVKVPADITVGGLEELLGGGLELAALGIDVLKAALQIADEKGLLTVGQLSLLENLVSLGGAGEAGGEENPALGPLGLSLKLFSDDPGSRGLFALIDASRNSPAGLNAEVAVGDILNVVLAVGSKNHALHVPNLNLNLGGLLKVESEVRVIEPPSIGIGPVGTTAHSANVRAFLRVCLLDGCYKSSSLLGLIRLGVDLPIVAEVVNGTGRLEQICVMNPRNNHFPSAEISVEASVLDLCVGKFDKENAFSNALSCVARMRSDPDSFNHKLIDLQLLGLPLLSLNSHLGVSAIKSESGYSTVSGAAYFDEGEIKYLPEYGNPLALGSTVKELVDGLLALLVGKQIKNSGGAISSEQAKKIAAEFWGESKRNVGCNVSSAICRGDIYRDVVNKMQSSVQGLHGFVGGLLGNVLGLVDDLLHLNLLGVVGNVVGVVGDLLNLLLKDILGNLLGFHPCTGYLTGSEIGCINDLAGNDLVKGTTDGRPNILFVLLGVVLDVLKAPLDMIGSHVLSPLLNGLGVRLGQVETNLISMDCEPKIRLVY
ncbi:putative membrane protein [Kerstersia gyiorum]|uniref:Putative membrane protein n=1 Tax=Kerstersia gyiorum TaxID=206506 RepID=A0A4Q7MPY9_9BURK|nr:pilus assembly protein TadG-related protein [Kerstersia gyiorum]RZS70320.1 putative membrane protein [Kerstersia gyiorum]